MKRFHHLEIFFYRALLIFCIIIKKTISGDCGKPYFEPYLTNPRNPNRIVGGWVAKPYSFPWTVHILTHVSGLLYESCGGSLISLDSTNASDTILTASHCVRVNNRLVNANAITVAAVCLPKQNQKLPWGEMCFVSGWGLTRESGKPSSKLRQVGIPILRNSNCPFIDADDMFCAGDMTGGKDSCQGDSGGPLVCKLNDTFVQMGIVSFGDGCARKDHPGIYTKVPHYVKWIYNQAAKLPDSSTSSEIGEEKPDYSNDFHHSWGSVGNYFHFPFFDSSDDIWNNENFGNENSPFSQLPWSFLSEPMPLFRSRSSFINRDVEEEAGDWSPYSTNQHFQTYYGLPHIGEEGQPHYPLENWPDMNGKYPLHHHSEFHPPYLYSNRPSMNEGHLSTPPNFESPENQPPYTSKNSPEMNGNQYSGKSYTKFYQPYLYPNGPSTNDHRPSLASNFEKPENQPQYTSKNRLEMSGNHHFGKSYRKNRPTYTSERRHEMNGNYYSGNRPPYSHSHRPTMNENRPPPPPDSQNFAYALNMKRWHPFGIPFHNAFLLFCIIIKETFSQYCGNPYFEPYFTNPHYPNQIVGEWVARPYSFPWTVHVLAHISGFWYESCVGSLISFDYTNASDTVLTSSHCVRVNNRLVDANAITVTAGAFNIRELNEPHRVTSKVLAYMSDNFGDVSKPNDVALLRLKVKIPHSHYISSVCLPYHSYQEMPWGETCFLSGWGFTRGRPLSELRQVGIPILRKSNCRFTDAYDIFCAGDMGGGNYSFQIDSGGPLVCKLNDSYVQIGIVSFGYNHAGKHYPGIFSNVPFYVNWIYNQLSWLPDSFNSSDIGGEESDCPDDCYHPWRSVFNHFKHRKASFHMDSLESTEGDGSDWSPYSTNQHYQSNYDGSQSGEGNRPPYSHSHRPTMNENRPPPPPDSQNFAIAKGMVKKALSLNRLHAYITVETSEQYSQCLQINFASI
ncbi:Plasminogen [Trichinella murrelli]|uniref:Plasminogen n=1 Tax=Trichinella murrelli TaxID=144512 RepID=A0A0V0U8U9_9BILA|nr:Plasminogen [Trichinella murrelli]